MPLTVRTNGSGGSNIIQAAWFNDFLSLLTGVMADQPITIQNSMTLEGVPRTNPTAPTLALVSGSGMGTGAYTYAVTYLMGSGETAIGSSTTGGITTTTGNNKVALSAIPTGPTGTTGRNVYRSKVGTSSPLYLVITLNDNTTTTYTDSTADASLGVQAPAHDSFGGSLRILNSSGTSKAQIFNDGAISFDGGNIISDGSGNITFPGGNSQAFTWLGSGGNFIAAINSDSGGVLKYNSAASNHSFYVSGNVLQAVISSTGINNAGFYQSGGVTLLGKGSDTQIAAPGSGNWIRFDFPYGTTQAHLDNSGNFVFLNGLHIQTGSWQVIGDDGGNSNFGNGTVNSYIKASSQTQFQIGGTDKFDVTTNGPSIPSGAKYTFVSGTMSRQSGGVVSCGSNTSISHGIGTTPVFILGTPVGGQPYSTTVGVGNLGSSTFNATIGSGSQLAYWGATG